MLVTKFSSLLRKTSAGVHMFSCLQMPDVFLRYWLSEGHEPGVTECPEGAIQIEIGIIADVWRNLATAV